MEIWVNRRHFIVGAAALAVTARMRKARALRRGGVALPSGTPVLHPGDAWTINGSGLPVIDLTNYGFNGDPTGDIETTSVGSTPDAGFNTGGGAADGGIANFNYERFNNGGNWQKVANDATRGKVLSTGTLNASGNSAAVEFVGGSKVGFGGRLRKATWVKSTVTSPGYDGGGDNTNQLKYFRVEGWDASDDISDEVGINYVVHDEYRGDGTWSMDIGSGSGIDTFYNIDTNDTGIVNNGWCRIELLIQTNSSAGTRDGQIWYRIIRMGATSVPDYSNSTTSGGVAMRSQAEPYPAGATSSDFFGSNIWQCYGKIATNWSFSLDDLLWTGGTWASGELVNSLTPSLATKRETQRVTSSTSSQMKGILNVGGGQFSSGDLAYIVARANQAADLWSGYTPVIIGS